MIGSDGSDGYMTLSPLSRLMLLAMPIPNHIRLFLKKTDVELVISIGS